MPCRTEQNITRADVLTILLHESEDVELKKKSLIICLSVIVLAMGYSSVVRAGSVSGHIFKSGVSIWDAGGWTEFQDSDNGSNPEDYRNGSYVNPGYGAQAFDAEYLFYKLDGDILSLGLQTGFDIGDGKYSTGGTDYWAGDLALSFDGSINYSHAVDFGLETKDWGQHLVGADGGVSSGGTHVGSHSADGIDAAGLYENVGWNTHVISAHSASNPFAMGDGNLVDAGGTNYDFAALNTSFTGTTEFGDASFYRQVSFNISQFRQSDNTLSVNAHWTMSCGNDAVNGSIHEPVPEPGTIALLGVGLAGLAGVGARRRLKKKAVDKS